MKLDSPRPVSYTHLDVYKRQMQNIEAAGFKVYIKTTDSNLDETKIAQMCGVDVGMLSMVPVSYTHLIASFMIFLLNSGNARITRKF